jgi:hypothetical protein
MNLIYIDPHLNPLLDLQIILNSLNFLLLHNMQVHLMLYMLVMKKSEEDWIQEGHNHYDWLQLYTPNMPLIHQV